MSSEAGKKIRLALLLAIVVAGLRAGYIFYERHQDSVAAEKQTKSENRAFSNPDDYVTPKKLYPYDLKSAKQLTQQPVWVKEGYRYTYYSYDPARKHVDFDHEAGTLLPIEQLKIKDVITATTPVKIAAGVVTKRQELMAIFEKDGKSFAVPIGFESDQQYKIYSDEMFYIEDPHQLYKHWSADIWNSVEHHEVKPGMNEMQADFAVGMGVPDAGSSNAKTVHYPNGGKPLVVTYHDGKAVEIKPGTPES